MARIDSSLLALQRTIGNRNVARLVNSRNDAAAVERVLGESGERLDPSTLRRMGDAFGHDFSDVRLHTSSAASASATQLQANAYTVGDHIVLRDGRGGVESERWRRTLAHELAHVVQQRRGPVDGSDNGAGLLVSDPNDRFERAADSAADRVVAAGIHGRASTGALAGVQRQTAAPPSATPLLQVQREGTLSDLGKHAKSLSSKKKKKKKDTTDDELKADWDETSNEVARHTHQALVIGEKVADLAREKLLYAGDAEGARKAEALAADFSANAALVAKGAKGFSWLVRKVKLAMALSELNGALRELNEVGDIRNDPRRAAKAFDSLFGAAGKIAAALPDGPWSGYFEFLTYFKEGKGFFSSMHEKLNPDARYNPAVLRRHGLNPDWSSAN